MCPFLHNQPMNWWNSADKAAKRALVAASLGWMLDGFDVMLYALVQKSVMADLHLTPAAAGSLQSFTLLAAAAGGLGFGVLADRWGRRRALILSVLLYSIFTAACGLASTVTQLACFRICLGLGMGGEWASGAALVSETWPDRHRGKALGLMQSSWAIGYALAAAVNWLVQDIAGMNWRAVFIVAPCRPSTRSGSVDGSKSHGSGAVLKPKLDAPPSGISSADACSG